MQDFFPERTNNFKCKFSAFILRNKCGGLDEKYSPIGSGIGTGYPHLQTLFGGFAEGSVCL